MGKPDMKPADLNINIIDIKIVIAIGICIFTATVLNEMNIKFHFHDMEIDIVQKATTAIACLLCVQDNLGSSKAAGWMRIKVTAMAAIASIFVIGIDSYLGNKWASIPLLMFGVIITMLLCKLIKAPYMNCRIGAISYVLIAVTLNGQARLIYALFRVLSTIYGIVIVLLVTWIFDLCRRKK